MESAIFFLVIGLLIGAAAAIVAAAIAHHLGRRAEREELLAAGHPGVICFCAMRDRRAGIEHEEERRVPRYREAGLAVAFLLAAGCAWPAPAAALQINANCFSEEQRDRTLKEQYHEKLVGNAAVSANYGRSIGIVELWIADETTTIMLVLPNDRNCVVFVGGPWRWVAPERSATPIGRTTDE